MGMSWGRAPPREMVRLLSRPSIIARVNVCVVGHDGSVKPVGWERGHVLVTNVKAVKGADQYKFDNNILISEDSTQYATVSEAADSQAPLYVYWNFLRLVKKG